MKRLTNNETSKDREARIPEGKAYGVFNGELQLFDKNEIVEKYGMSFEEMTENHRLGTGIFELPKKWLPKGKEEAGKAEWREVYQSQATYYYYDK